MGLASFSDAGDPLPSSRSNRSTGSTAPPITGATRSASSAAPGRRYGELDREVRFRVAASLPSHSVGRQGPSSGAGSRRARGLPPHLVQGRARQELVSRFSLPLRVRIDGAQYARGNVTSTRSASSSSLDRSTSTMLQSQPARSGSLRCRDRPPGAGMVSSASSATSIHSSTASAAFAQAASSVSPAEKHPGRSGTTTPKGVVSSPGSIAIGNFMLLLLTPTGSSPRRVARFRSRILAKSPGTCSTNSSSGASARRRISSAIASSMVLQSASSSRSL